jgi:hypothetical protein
VICIFLLELFFSESLNPVHDVRGLHIVDAYFKQYSGTIFLTRRCKLVGEGRMVRIIRKVNNSACILDIMIWFFWQQELSEAG